MVAAALLKNYHLLDSSQDIEFRDMLMDLQQAIKDADLNDIELAVVKETYLSGPMIPERTGQRGRPRGAGMQGRIAMSLKEDLKAGLIRKRTTVQHTEYHDLHRSIKQYKKVLNRALEKIDQSLNYGGTFELSSASLRHLPKKYITQV